MRTILLIAGLFSVLTLTACATAKRAAPEADYAMASDEASLDESSSGQRANTEVRKLIKSGEQSVKVKQIDEAARKVDALATQSGGYVENQEAGDRSARMTLRVPAAKLEETMNQVANLGKEEQRRVQVDDVTKQVIDLKAQLQNAVALRDQLRELSKRATAVKEILEIEHELTRVQTEIDQLQASLKAIESSVALSRLEVNLNKERVLGPLGYLGYGVAWAVEKLFVIE